MSRSDTGSRATRAWWKEAVVYQVYPRSFNDSDGDGIGDLRGIIEKVDYLDNLGVDVVWLSPVYDSPNHDNGYDIRDYRAIMAAFGTIADFDELLESLHDRDIKLIMDLVVNHTSNEHDWFQQSRRREAGYTDYYHWQDGPPEEPPNNWTSIFGGPAWTYDQTREQWYLHLFHETQPDLNWRNPQVRDDVSAMMRWWLERGIDGFRMDAINLLSKPAGYPDGAPGGEFVGGDHVFNGPRLETYLDALVDVLEGYDAMTVAEMSATDVETAAQYLEDGVGLGMIFQSAHLGLDAGPDGIWDPTDWGEIDLPTLKQTLTRWQTGLQGRGWNAVFLGNHDQPRIVSRFGDDSEYRRESATLLATLLLTLSGTPYLYQGDEIGMTNTTFDSLVEVDDVETIGSVTALFEDGFADDFADVQDLVNYWCRDHARTPMQWSDATHAGFSDHPPWLAVTQNYNEINLAAERARSGINSQPSSGSDTRAGSNSNSSSSSRSSSSSSSDSNSGSVSGSGSGSRSIWHQYRRLIEMRHQEDTLVYGTYELHLPAHPHLYVYTRTLDDEVILVVLNWSETHSSLESAPIDPTNVEVLASNYQNPSSDPTAREFRPYEAGVYRSLTSE